MSALHNIISKKQAEDSHMTNVVSQLQSEVSEESSELQLKIIISKPKYVPPLNFSLVEDGIYRSGHPMPINYPFLSALNLKMIIYLGDKEDMTDYYDWIKQEGISFKYLKMKSSAEPFVINDPEALTTALHLILDKRNYPMLIHSNKGKHRIGVLVGLIRKLLQGWSISGIFDEYEKFAAGKGEFDLEFIEVFNPILSYTDSYKPDFVRI